MIHFVVPAQQEFGMRDYLAAHDPGPGREVRILHYESLPTRTTYERGTYVFAALDQLDPAMLRLATEVHGQLRATGCTLLNDPARTLHRFALLAELHRLGRNDFRAVRATDDVRGLRYPVFVRDGRAHDGPQSQLLATPADAEAAIGRVLLQGRRIGDLLVVEFCSTADADGRFRKYAAFVVGDRIVPRSLAFGPEWMLKHRATEYTAASVREERDYVVGNPHERELAEIFALAGVRYGRIDYAMLGDRVQTWEINLNPTIGRGLRPSRGVVPPELEAIRAEAKAHFYRAFRDALERVDTPAVGEPVRVAVAPRIASAARASATGARRRGRLGALLGPARPLLRPVAGLLLPTVGRLARLAAALRG